MLETIVNETEVIFEQAELKLPEPPIYFKDKILALEEANLPKQRSTCIYDMRKWQANKLGFKEITVVDCVEILMGEKHTKEKDGERQNLEYLYNHHNGEMLEGWGSLVKIYSCESKKGFWYLPPFAKFTKWEVQSGKLDYLKRDMPYGVILKINELKKLKLFNSFGVVAPMEAWLRQTDIDPIVIASISQISPNDKGNYDSTSATTNYFIAKW